MVPRFSKAIVLRHIEGRKGEVYYPLEKVSLPIPSLQPHELLVKLSAAALNHRDFFVRQNLYPKVQFGVPICSDGAGKVIALGSSAARKWLDQRVIINPGLGWDSAPDAPEAETGYLTLGASLAGKGTLQEYLVIDERDVFATPEHLSDVEAAALSTAGLTSWRALAQSGNLVPGRNILITGIGGGVAVMAMQLALAAGCYVFVTSSKEEKIRKAKGMSAKGGVLYTLPDWDERLLKLLPSERSRFDAIIDSAGGDIVERGTRLLKTGGTIATFGMTLGPSISYPMKAVLRQLRVVGSTMGSRRDFDDMLACVRANRIRPVVSRTVQGIEDVGEIDAFIGELKQGDQFGKLVIEIESGGLSRL